MIVTKSQFADMSNVGRPRVSQWISEGKISGSAIVGSGRRARIDVEKARRQLRERLDIDKMCGLQGLDTKLDTKLHAEPVDDDDADDDLALEALKAFDRLLGELPITSLRALAAVRAEADEAFRQAEGKLRHKLRVQQSSCVA
jgi:hypothetical protein